MENLPESTMNILIGGIFGLVSMLLSAIFDAIMLYVLKRDEMMLQHRLDMLAKRQELLFKHQLEEQQRNEQRRVEEQLRDEQRRTAEQTRDKDTRSAEQQGAQGNA
jgi:hypothetical protein